jgi:hypothetical protein
MSAHLRDKMIVAALVETNNMFQFSKFSDEHFHQWRTNQEDPVQLGSTFIGSFQIWLRTYYPSNKGNHLRNNKKEGTVWYMCCKILPVLIVTRHNNVQMFQDTITDSRNKP